MTTPVIAFVPPAAELELQTISELPAEPTLFYKREEFKTADDHCVPTPPLPESHNRATPAESELPRRDTEEQDEQADPTSPLSPSASQAAQQSWSTEKRVHLPFPYGPRLARLEAAKWRRLFPLYKHIEIPCLPFIRPISIISLIVALVYVVVNLAIFIPLLVQMINGTGTTTNCTGKGGRNGGTDNYATNCIAQGTYNAAATLGTIGSVNFLLLMLPMNRFSVLTALLGISVDRGIMWHKWIVSLHNLCVGSSWRWTASGLLVSGEHVLGGVGWCSEPQRQWRDIHTGWFRHSADVMEVDQTISV